MIGLVLGLVLSLGTLISTHLLLSAPFCVLQLALLKYSKSQVLRSAPAAAALVGLVCGWWIIADSSGWDAFFGLFILFPSWLCLVGCGLGHLFWQLAQRHL